MVRLVRPESPATSCTLRIIQITDVYVLDHFPHLATLIREKRDELSNGKTISMLTGDFLAPYLLSSLDNGVGMMNMINATPIDYLTWGNHEDDVGHANVLKREKEYRGCWINTNMQTHETFATSTCQKDHEVIEIISPDGTNKRSIGLIGVLSNSPSLYKPSSFGGATIDDPWETMAHWKAKLEGNGCDIVIPLCHLYEPQDERTCREFDFPVILSGHDHHVVDKTVNGTRLLKPGLDARQAFMVDVTWTTQETEAPRIEATLLTCQDWPPDPALKELCKKSYSVLDPLRKTELAKIPSAYRPLTSFNARGCRVSMGTYLLSRLRDAMNMHDLVGGEPTVDCCLLKGGNVRGGRNYGDSENMTLETLQSEIEETKEVLVIPVPGLVLRVGFRETYGVPNPGWMQYDDGVVLDGDGECTHVNGKPIDLTKVYKVGSIVDFWRKSDSPTIGAYFEVHPHSLPEPDSGVNIHYLLMRLFAAGIWTRIFKAMRIDLEKGSFDPEAFRRIDADGDGKLSKADLQKALADVVGFETFAGQEVVVDQMFGVMADFANSERGNQRGPMNDSPDEEQVIEPRMLAQVARSMSETSLASMANTACSSDDD